MMCVRLFTLSSGKMLGFWRNVTKTANRSKIFLHQQRYNPQERQNIFVGTGKRSAKQKSGPGVEDDLAPRGLFLFGTTVFLCEREEGDDIIYQSLWVVVVWEFLGMGGILAGEWRGNWSHAAAHHQAYGLAVWIPCTLLSIVATHRMCGEEYDEDPSSNLSFIGHDPRGRRLSSSSPQSWDDQDIAYVQSSLVQHDDVGLQSCHVMSPQRSASPRDDSNDVCMVSPAKSCQMPRPPLGADSDYCLHDLHHDTLCLYLASFEKYFICIYLTTCRSSPLHLLQTGTDTPLSVCDSEHPYPSENVFHHAFDALAGATTGPDV